MSDDPSVRAVRRCALCEGEISDDRRRAVPLTRLCVGCQSRVERGRAAAQASGGLSPYPAEGGPVTASDDAPKLSFEGERLAIGAWSESIVDASARSSQLHRLLDTGDRAGAADLVRALPLEAQVALVAMDVDPEQVLSLTGMGGDGKPAYRTAVIDLLPAELLTEVISVDPEEKKFNTDLIRAMSPRAFGRTLAETLSGVDNPLHRSKVTWGWLIALAEMDDANRAGALLAGVDPSLLEEAILDHLGELDLHGLVPAGEYAISRFRLFSEKGAAAVSLAEHIEDPDTKAVIRALGEAAPDLLRYIVRAAWEVSGAGSVEEGSDLNAEEGGP